MHTWEAAILGLIQGLTEFLPVSSSGHLVLVQSLFGIKGPLLSFDIMVHLATLCSLAAVFRKDIAWLWRSVLDGGGLARSEGNPRSFADGRRLVLLLAVGTAPVAVTGLLLHRPIESLFVRPTVAGLMLLVTGLLLWATRRFSPGLKGLKAMGWSDAALIGVAQAIGMMPGISRTGITIVMALALGLERDLAARYSLLLGIPAIAGAVVFSLVKVGFAPAGLGAVLAAMAIAFVTGYVALRIVVRMVVSGRLAAFAPYCWLVGLVVILLAATA